MSVYEKFGGIRPMAAKLGVPVSTVSSWCDKGIPHWRHDQILSAARDAGFQVTQDDLLHAKVERRRRPKRRPEAPEALA